jgi:hypothetical protein
MFEVLYNYGMGGIFIAYLIYDRQVLIKKINTAIDGNTQAFNNLIEHLKGEK